MLDQRKSPDARFPDGNERVRNVSSGDLYFFEVRRYDLLTETEEQQLAMRMDRGNLARQRLIQSRYASFEKQGLISLARDGQDAFNRLVYSLTKSSSRMGSFFAVQPTGVSLSSTQVVLR